MSDLHDRATFGDHRHDRELENHIVSRQSLRDHNLTDDAEPP